MKKKKKGLIILAAIVVVVVVVVVAIPKNTAPVMSAATTEALAKTDLRSTVSATGVVESNTTQNVYSKLATAQLKTVNVEVGDKITAGDVMAQFDTEDIEDQIAQQKASISDNAAKGQLSIKQSEKNYNQQLSDFQNDKDATLLKAQNAVSNASDAVKDAQFNVEHFGDDVTSIPKKDIEDGTEAQKDKYDYTIYLHSYNTSVELVEQAKKDLEAAQKTGDAQKIKNAQDYLSSTQSGLRDAKQDFEIAKSNHPTYHHQYEQATTALKQAQENLELAMEQYEITFNGTLTGIDSAADSVANSKLNASQNVAKLTLENTEKQLLDATVTAPVSGTVTAVYAKEGAVSNGLMFVIENTESLKVTTSIKEFDLASVKVGQKAEIKSDATGETIMQGTVTSIAPTAMKAADGSTKSGSVEFETEISVDGSHDGLRIGMNARVNIITAEKQSVYAVPFDAVLTDETGSYIYTAIPGEKEIYTAKKLPVTLGLETDFYLEIISDELTDGTIVVTNPVGITEGSQVPVAAAPVSSGV